MHTKVDFVSRPHEMIGSIAKGSNSSCMVSLTELRTSPAIRDHTVLSATRHKWTRPALTQAHKQVLDLPTPEGWKAELT